MNNVPGWQQLYQQITADPLRQVRDAAGKWTGIFSALIGVSTIVGLIQGRSTLEKLSFGTLVGVVVLFVTTLFITVLAVYLAASASEGTPRNIVEDEEAFALWYKEATAKAKRNLWLSKIFALIAVVLLVGTLIVSWLGPMQPDAGTSVLAVQRSGGVVCGILAKDRSGNLLLTRQGLPSILLNNVVTFSIISSCP